MHQSGGKIKTVISKISLYFCIIQPFQILIGRFQNISKQDTEQKYDA